MSVLNNFMRALMAVRGLDAAYHSNISIMERSDYCDHKAVLLTDVS